MAINNVKLTSLLAALEAVAGLSLLVYAATILSEIMPLPADCYKVNQTIQWRHHCDQQRQTSGVAMVAVLAAIFQTSFSAWILCRRGVLKGAWLSLWPLCHLGLLCIIITGFVIGVDRQMSITMISGQEASIIFLVMGCLDTFLCLLVLVMGAWAILTQHGFV